MDIVSENIAVIDLPIIAESQSYSRLAVTKINNELSMFKGGMKEKTVSKFVASTLVHFCEADEQFAEVVSKTPRTLSDCCAEVMCGCGNQVSDIDVYRGAAQFYFPNSEIHFNMEIRLTGAAPSEDEINRPPKISSTGSRDKSRQKPNKDKTEKTGETIHLSLF